MKIKLKSNLAFTLIELLVVIAIVGILSGLILITMSGATESARIAKLRVYSNSVRDSLGANLLAEWKFDAGTINNTAVTGDILDSWGTNNAASVQTSPGPIIKGGTDCVVGNCLYFDGIDDVINLGGQATLSMGTNDHTVSIWVNFDNALAVQRETLFAGGAGCGAASNCGGYWIVRSLNSDRLFFNFADGSAGYVSGYLSETGSLVNNTWHNIVVVFDRDQTAQAYINGVKTSYSVDISSKQASVYNYKGLTIGSWSAPDSSHLVGKVDEARIFSTALATSQIKEQYYAGLNKLLANKEITKEEYEDRMEINN